MKTIKEMEHDFATKPEIHKGYDVSGSGFHNWLKYNHPELIREDIVKRPKPKK